MNATLLAIRAVVAAYVHRFLLPALCILLGVYMALMLLIWWLATNLSAWWWLFAVPVTIVVLVGCAVWFGLRYAIRRMTPEMNVQRHEAVARIVRRIDEVAEQVGTPKYIVLYRAIRLTLFHSQNTRVVIGDILNKPDVMRREFDDLKALF